MELVVDLTGFAGDDAGGVASFAAGGDVAAAFGAGDGADFAIGPAFDFATATVASSRGWEETPSRLVYSQDISRVEFQFRGTLGNLEETEE